MGTLEPADAAATLLGDDPLSGDARLALAHLLLTAARHPDGEQLAAVVHEAVTALTEGGAR